MDVKPGARLRSTTGSVEVVVVRAPTDPLDVRCGGRPMVAAGGDAPAIEAVEAGFDGGCQLGKRYADERLGVELLCVVAGEGALSVGDAILELKGAKPLPSSD